MSTIEIKTQIKNISEEALTIGYSKRTIDGYENIWDNFIKWKNQDIVYYDSEDYDRFLLEYYCFDINTFTNKSKSHFQQLFRSKKILEDFDCYKKSMLRTALPRSLYNNYPNDWNKVFSDYLNYLKNVKQNKNKTIYEKERYLKRELSYFYQKGMNSLSDFSSRYINMYITDTINAGNKSKRRNFGVLKEFLSYLFMEDIIDNDLSLYIPRISEKKKKKIPTYFNQEEIEEILNSIPRERKVEKRDYAIIVIAARLGLRISDILNIKLKDIDWQNNKLNVIQPKTNNLNILPLSKEIGWSIIDYIKVRPKCDNEYLFVKQKYPLEKLNQFNEFNKYFDKVDIVVNSENKKGIHNLRHSIAKNMLENDIPLQIISDTLGHSSTETTASTYLKIDYKNLKKCTLEVSE